MEETTTTARVGDIAGGEKSKARDISRAIRTLRAIEEEGGRQHRTSKRHWPASPVSGRWPCRSFPILLPVATRTPAGRFWAMS